MFRKFFLEQISVKSIQKKFGKQVKKKFWGGGGMKIFLAKIVCATWILSYSQLTQKKKYFGYSHKSHVAIEEELMFSHCLYISVIFLRKRLSRYNIY
jgi:hypothetical protein